MIKAICKQYITLYQHTSSYVLFPTKAMQNFWTRKIAQYHSGIALSKFITFHDVLSILQHQLIDQEKHSYRILTHQESYQLAMELLLDKTVIDIISRIEGVDFNNAKKDELLIYYAPKILNLFNTYCLFQINAKQKKFSHYIFMLLQKYVALLESYRCIDTATLLLIASQGAFTFEPLAIQVVHHKRLSPEKHATLQYFYEQGILSEYVNIPTSYTPISHTRGTTPILKVFNNITQEIEYICKNISTLLQNGTDAHDIAISVCQLDTDMQIEIQRIAQQYAVPIHLPIYHCPILPLLLQEVHSSNFHPFSMQKLLSDPSIPWKYRTINMQIVQHGIKDVYVDTPTLKRWKKVLRNKDEYNNNFEHIKNAQSLLHYFELLQQSIIKIITASSYQDLASTLKSFIAYFINDESQKIGSWQYIFLDVLNALQVFEQYINRNTSTHSVIQQVTPWTLFRQALEQYHIQKSNHISSVPIYQYPKALGTYYPHHFVINLNQAGINTGVSLPTSFSDVLITQYINTTVTEKYRECNTYIADNIIHAGDTIWMSNSNTSYQGIQILPVNWEYEDSHDTEINMWNTEQYFWDFCTSKTSTVSLNNVAPTVYINSQQKKGLEYQHDIGLGDTTLSMFKHHLPVHTCKMLQTHITEKVVLNPSVLPQALVFPAQYFFENVLYAIPYIPNNNLSYLDTREFSSIIHKMFQICAKHIIELQHDHNDIQSKNFDTTINNISPSDNFYQIIKNEIFQKYNETVEQSSIHSFMKPILLHAFDDRIFVAYIKNFINELQNNQAYIKSVEEDIIIDLSTLHQKKNIFPPFTLKGRPDLVCYNPQKEYHKVYDYKFYRSQMPDVEQEIIKKIGQCIQLWAYFLLIKQDESAIIVQKTQEHDIESQVLLYDIVKSIQEKDEGVFFPNFDIFDQKMSKTKKESELKKWKNRKNIIVDTLHYFSDLCANALQQCYNGSFYNPNIFNMEQESNIEQIRYMLHQGLYSTFSTQVILRNQCYIYPNTARGPVHEH